MWRADSLEKSWERLRAGGEGDDRRWDGWMASLTQWTWVWVDSGSWWWTGRPGVLRFMGSQSRTWLSSWTELIHYYLCIFCFFPKAQCLLKTRAKVAFCVLPSSCSLVHRHSALLLPCLCSDHILKTSCYSIKQAFRIKKNNFKHILNLFYGLFSLHPYLFFFPFCCDNNIIFVFLHVGFPYFGLLP